MIVIMSLVDEVPILTIAYNNTPVSETPVRCFNRTFHRLRVRSLADVKK